MRKEMIGMVAALAVGGVVIGSVAEAQGLGGGFRERLRQRMEQRMGQGQGGGQRGDAVKPTRSLSYGPDSLQVLDFWQAVQPSSPTEKFRDVRPAPLIVFVHGGGWKRGSKDNAAGSFKQVHYPGEGYAYAAINYRLVPQATVEQQAADVAMAVKALVDRASELGIDQRRIVLMGHSAGAHLVALVGSDEQYLRAAGLSFRDIAGVIPVDGACYDVPKQIAEGGNFMRDTYVQAFGTDPARQRALSPVFHAEAPNAPSFLLLHVQRKDGIAQAKELEAALAKGGTAVERRDFPGQGLQGHAEINRKLGDPAYAATPVVDAWLQRVFAR